MIAVITLPFSKPFKLLPLPVFKLSVEAPYPLAARRTPKFRSIELTSTSPSERYSFLMTLNSEIMNAAQPALSCSAFCRFQSTPDDLLSASNPTRVFPDREGPGKTRTWDLREAGDRLFRAHSCKARKMSSLPRRSNCGRSS